ncbi:MAG: hypothetical protein A2798_00690 [Candidatus Levybacteria bacterium RIFCSPHIGHO2_01_FULL_37_17]|nr:MAG: hypothetical protein A2798_00690 [Candidatus Levybacteria bacterium RIFCSPHIGHO2_01_FULL_37_17]OGH36971.1 MAG: hypothetical protein A2959_01550 [Candidatus Levybacteria bacterium RIFCSPLOWO2_01_FULL_38_23]
MSKNPIINALTALLYIVMVSLFMFYGTRNLPKEDTVFAPIAVLSLFTLSAAVMGYVFLFYPLQLYLDGKKKESINLFSKTLLYFAAFTLIVFVILFSGIYKMFL